MNEKLSKAKNNNEIKSGGCPLCKILKPLMRVGLLVVIILMAILVGAGLQNQVMKQWEAGYSNGIETGIDISDVSDVAWYKLSGEVVNVDDFGILVKLRTGKLVKVVVNENSEIFKNEDCCSGKEDRFILKDEILEGTKVEVESIDNIIGKNEIFGHKIAVF
jgi:hypothetical protein